MGALSEMAPANFWPESAAGSAGLDGPRCRRHQLIRWSSIVMDGAGTAGFRRAGSGPRRWAPPHQMLTQATIIVHFALGGGDSPRK